MKTKDGGYAFPVMLVDIRGNPVAQHCGLTKRDYFAAKAMQARIIALGNHQHEGRDMKEAEKKVQECHEETARRAYQHANAMIAESERET